MLNSNYFITIATKELRKLYELKRLLARLPAGMSYQQLCLADAQTKRKYRWSTISDRIWETRYSFPPITLVVGDELQTKRLVTQLVHYVNNTIKLDVEFKNISMHELIANNNKPLNNPKGQDGGYLILEYKEGLTDKNIYELTSHILMNKNTDNFSVFEGLEEDQNWRSECESFHKGQKDIMAWVKTGWNLIVIADSKDHYNPITEGIKGFRERIYSDLAYAEKWRVITAWE